MAAPATLLATAPPATLATNVAAAATTAVADNAAATLESLQFLPTNTAVCCPCGVTSHQECAANPGECEPWGEYVVGHNRTSNPEDVRTRGKLDHKCRLVLQREGLLGKGTK